MDICIVTETWLEEDKPDNIVNIENYRLERRDRIERTGGGVCFFIKKGIQYKRWETLEQNTFETMWITIFPN